MSLTIVATISAKPERIEFVQAQLHSVVEPTRQELGCWQYDLHQDQSDPTVFLFFERWQSHEHWQQHNRASHMIAYRAAVVDALAKPTEVRQMKLIS